jgi:DNA-binding Lrp family transcriptional regulator
MPLKINESTMDELDIRILNLMLVGRDSKSISGELEKPLSTIQRRVRHLVVHGLVKNATELNYAKLGFKKGFLHVYLQDGNIRSTSKQLLNFDGILEVATHIGNSDLIGKFVFTESRQVLDLITNTKKLDGVERVVWSEEVEVIRKNVELNPSNH